VRSFPAPSVVCVYSSESPRAITIWLMELKIGWAKVIEKDQTHARKTTTTTTFISL